MMARRRATGSRPSEAGTNGSNGGQDKAVSVRRHPESELAGRPISIQTGAGVETTSGRTSPPERGQTSARISREIVQLHARLYGRGPTKARTFVEEEYVLCVLEEVFTVAERTLIRAGNSGHVITTRMAVQDAMQDEFVALVEEATQRSVRALISQVHIGTALAVELFLLNKEKGPSQPETSAEE